MVRHSELFDARFEDRLDRLTTALLPPLRSSKTVDGNTMAKLISLLDELRSKGAALDLVPRGLVGKLWFIFTQLLTEAEYAKYPEPILDAAWTYEDRLTQFFGPQFD